MRAFCRTEIKMEESAMRSLLAKKLQQKSHLRYIILSFLKLMLLATSKMVPF